MHFSAFLHLGKTIYLKTFSAPSLKFNDALDITGLYKYQTGHSLTQFIPDANPNYLLYPVSDMPCRSVYRAALSPQAEKNPSRSHCGQTHKALIALTISPVVR